MGNNKTFVFILGMHRSGTSALAGSLQEQGVYLGQVYKENPFNKKGNRENPDVMNLNESVLEYNGGTWDNPPENITWSIEHERIGQQIVESFLESTDKVYGFKDPRTLFTLKFWLEVFKSFFDIKYVGTFRHPLSVAKSLLNRNHMPIEDGINLWEIYNTRLHEIQHNTGFPLISFDVYATEYKKAIEHVTDKLNIQKKTIKNNVFFDGSLRHYEDIENPIIPKRVLNLYQKLQKTYQENRYDS